MKQINYMSKMYTPTLKEVPSEAEIPSHKLMLKSGMIRKTASGIYSFLPIAQKILKKIENIIREEVDAIGGQEILMPAMQPAELWYKSGRWDDYGPELVRLKDRHNRDFCLGPTHEEVITDLVNNELKSYKQLPTILYQIQVKFRDEIRPRFGLMRGREFLMKDAYSFHADQESMDKIYSKFLTAYRKIFTRCGLKFIEVEADSGQIGGNVSVEFMVLAKNGEAEVAYCDCGYGADTEVLGFDANDESPRDISCPKCGKKCKIARGIEVGQVFQLGTKYSKSMNVNFIGKDGREHPFIMGCYGIGVTRVMAAAIEQKNDEAGIIWPINIAPWHVDIITLCTEAEDKAQTIAKNLARDGVDVMIDDRDIRAGVKFSDADLIGFPYQIIIGSKGLKNNTCEVKCRETGQRYDVKFEDMEEFIKDRVLKFDAI